MSPKSKVKLFTLIFMVPVTVSVLTGFVARANPVVDVELLEDPDRTDSFGPENNSTITNTLRATYCFTQTREQELRKVAFGLPVYDEDRRLTISSGSDVSFIDFGVRIMGADPLTPSPTKTVPESRFLITNFVGDPTTATPRGNLERWIYSCVPATTTTDSSSLIGTRFNPPSDPKNNILFSFAPKGRFNWVLKTHPSESGPVACLTEGLDVPKNSPITADDFVASHKIVFGHQMESVRNGLNLIKLMSAHKREFDKEIDPWLKANMWIEQAGTLAKIDSSYPSNPSLRMWAMTVAVFTSQVLPNPGIPVLSDDQIRRKLTTPKYLDPDFNPGGCKSR